MAKSKLKRKRKIPYYPDDRFIPFLSDYGFKVTFGDKDRTDFARKALEIILEEDGPILELKYLRNEFAGIAFDARSGLYDVICQDERKRVFIVEMQVENYEHLIERLQFYTFHLFSGMVSKGKGGFANLSPIYCICIIRGTILDNMLYHQIIAMKNQENEVIMNNVVFHLVELGKFPIAKNRPELALTPKEKLFYTMRYAHTFDPEIKEQHPPFWEDEFYQIALRPLDLSRMSSIERALYENSLLREHVVREKIEKDREAAVQRVREQMESILQVKVKELEEKGKILEEKDKVLEEKDKVLEEKDKVLEEKDKVLEEKDKVLEEKDKLYKAAIERLLTIANLPAEQVAVIMNAPLDLVLEIQKRNKT